MQYRLLFLIAGDLFFGVAALFGGFLLRFGYDQSIGEAARKPFANLALFLSVLVVSSYIFEIYNLAKHGSRREIFSHIASAACVSFVVLSIIYFMMPPLIIGRGLLGLSLSLFVCYQYFWHMVFMMVHDKSFLAENILILGTGASALAIGDFVQSPKNNFGYTLSGYVSGGNGGGAAVSGRQIIGRVDDLAEIVRRERVSQVVMSEQVRQDQAELQHVLLNCKLHGVKIVDAPSFLEPMTGKLMLEYLDMNWLIYADGFLRPPVYVAIKRLMDIVLSVIGIILSLPLFPVIALLIKLDSPGPIFFTQTRVGQWGKNFVLYKFRTMNDDAERETGAVWAQKNDLRVRPIGRFLRKYRFDEIPQLFNVLKGDMSFVGPRPERPEFVEELDRQIPFYAKRHFIKPGITGWAQIKYAYGASVKDAYEKMQYDLYYFKHMSLLEDLMIIMKTFRVVIFGKGR